MFIVLAVSLWVTACNQSSAMKHSDTHNSANQDFGRQDRELACKEPRPEICTMEYLPVCGLSSDEFDKTYASACTACSNPQVNGYRKGACK